MKTFWVVYEIDGEVEWDSITAQDAEDARKRMTTALIAQGYAESDIVIVEVSEGK